MTQRDPIEDLVRLLTRLPGVGTKSATRLAFHLITAPKEYTLALAGAIGAVATEVRRCTDCGAFTTETRCRICTDPRRDGSILCVVSGVQDLLALERAGSLRGRYHVLNGLLSPLDGVGPEDLRISELVDRVRTSPEPVREVILAICPSVQGETTVLFLSQALANLDVRITRIAAGVPIGGELEYTDQVTLARALAERREV